MRYWWQERRFCPRGRASTLGIGANRVGRFRAGGGHPLEMVVNRWGGGRSWLSVLGWCARLRYWEEFDRPCASGGRDSPNSFSYSIARQRVIGVQGDKCAHRQNICAHRW